MIDLQLVVFRGGNAPHYVLSLLSWLLQGNNTGFRRFMVIIGCVMSMREVRLHLDKTAHNSLFLCLFSSEICYL